MQFETTKEWRMAIDPIKESDNWYIKNINKYGYSKYLFKLSIVFTIIEDIIHYIVIVFIDKQLSPWPRRYVFANIWFGIIHLIPVIVCTCIFFRIEKEIYEDNLGILKEIKSECGIGLLGAMCAIISIIVASPDYIRVIFSIQSVIISPLFLYFAIIYPQRLFNKYKNRPVNLIMKKLDKEIKKQLKNEKHNKKTKDIDVETVSATTTSTVISPLRGTSLTAHANNATKRNTVSKSWKSIVSTYDGYIALMGHLGKEFSTENLLFVQEVESTQLPIDSHL